MHALRSSVGTDALKELSIVEGCRRESSRRLEQNRYVDQVLMRTS